jgi:hypothetical protein
MKKKEKKGGKKRVKRNLSNNKKFLRKQLHNESTYGTILGIFVL